jgi:flagellar basal body P-ring formation protein FlgA
VALFLALALGAAAAAQADVPVLARSVERGELLGRADFLQEPRPAVQARGAVGPAEAAGLEAVRRLPAGSIVRRADLAEPQLVRRGEPVTLTVEAGALVITAQGRALSGGGVGDPVRVVNLATSRTIEGRVAGPGRVRVTAP